MAYSVKSRNGKQYAGISNGNAKLRAYAGMNGKSVKMIQTTGPNKGHVIVCAENNQQFWAAEGYKFLENHNDGTH